MPTSIARKSLKKASNVAKAKVPASSCPLPSVDSFDLNALTEELRSLKTKIRRRTTRQSIFGDPCVYKRFLSELDSTRQAIVDAQCVDAPHVAYRPIGASANAYAPLVIDTTANMVGNGLLVKPERFQQLMGWTTRQAVWKALASNRVFAMALGTERFFPVFFSDAAYERKHLEEVTKMLGQLPGGAKMQFFLSRKGSLSGKTVLEALAAGNIEKVRDLALAYAEA